MNPNSNPANLNIRDNADEFRVEVTDRFAGGVVITVQSLWEEVLLESGSRRFTIDISQLTGYDQAGFALLHKMHLHGAYVVANTPASLMVLEEISGPLKLGLALLCKSPGQAHYPGTRSQGNLFQFPSLQTGSDD